MTGDGSEYLRPEDLRELGDDSLPSSQFLDGMNYLRYSLEGGRSDRYSQETCPHCRQQGAPRARGGDRKRMVHCHAAVTHPAGRGTLLCCVLQRLQVPVLQNGKLSPRETESLSGSGSTHEEQPGAWSAVWGAGVFHHLLLCPLGRQRRQLCVTGSLTEGRGGRAIPVGSE